jgi:hypothetical protein
MRCFVRVLLGCLIAASVSAPLYAENAAASSETAAKGTAPSRLTIAAIGDSLGDGLWEGLHRQLRSNKRFAV